MMERFTRLDPAPEVKIDKEKYVKTLKLLALRVPKVRHPTKRAALFSSVVPPPPPRASFSYHARD